MSQSPSSPPQPPDAPSTKGQAEGKAKPPRKSFPGVLATLFWSLHNPGEAWTTFVYNGQEKPDAEPAPVPARKKKRSRVKSLLIVLALCLLGGAVFWKTRPTLQVVDYFPKEGARGSYVLIELTGPVKGTDLYVAYKGEPIPYTVIMESTIGLNIPLNAVTGEIEVTAMGKSIGALPFSVLEPVVTPVHSISLTPSAEITTVKTDTGISVTLPPGLLRDERTLRITKVEHAAVYRGNPFREFKVIDVTLSGMTQLDDYIEIGIPFDPALLDPEQSAEAQVSAMRWDETTQTWQDLFYRVDPQTSTLYMVTDHLSFFALELPTIAGMLKAAGFAALAVPISYAWEYFANDVHISCDGKIRILYSDRSMRQTFPDKDWQRIIAPASLSTTYDDNYSFAVQDIATIFCESLQSYIAAGFPDPTRIMRRSTLSAWQAGDIFQDGQFYTVYTAPVKIKIDSYFVEYFAEGEFSHEPILTDTIHVPSAGIVDGFYVPVQNQRAHRTSFDDSFHSLKSKFAHELFHVIQRPHYGYRFWLHYAVTQHNLWTTYVGDPSPHKWWIEATAEWAGHDLALVRDRPGWDQLNSGLVTRIGPRFLAHPINSIDQINGTWSGADYNALAYEYLSAAFVRFLVTEKNHNIVDLLSRVASGGDDALATLRTVLHPFQPVYEDFAAWLLKESSVPLSNFAGKRNVRVAADREDEIVLGRDEERLQIFKKDNCRFGFLRVFRPAADLEFIDDTSDEWTLLYTEPDEPEWIDVTAGDILYFLIPNGEDRDREVEITLKRRPPREPFSSSEPPLEDLASSTWTVAKDGTAKIWAVRFLGRPDLAVTVQSKEPMEGTEDSEEPVYTALPEEEVTFVLSAANIPSTIREVVFEHDILRGQVYGGLAKSDPIAVSADGTAIHEVTRTVPKDTSRFPVLVRLLDASGSEELSRGKAALAMYYVTLSPRGELSYPLPQGETEVTLAFEATGGPEGAYRYAWEFGDGSPVVTQEKGRGEKSAVTHTYRNLRVGQRFDATVKLFHPDGSLLARNAAAIRIEEVSEEETPVVPMTTVPELEGGWALESVEVYAAPGRLPGSSISDGAAVWRYEDTGLGGVLEVHWRWSPPKSFYRGKEMVRIECDISISEFKPNHDNDVNKRGIANTAQRMSISMETIPDQQGRRQVFLDEKSSRSGVEVRVEATHRGRNSRVYINDDKADSPAHRAVLHASMPHLVVGGPGDWWAGGDAGDEKMQVYMYPVPGGIDADGVTRYDPVIIHSTSRLWLGKQPPRFRIVINVNFVGRVFYNYIWSATGAPMQEHPAFRDDSEEERLERQKARQEQSEQERDEQERRDREEAERRQAERERLERQEAERKQAERDRQERERAEQAPPLTREREQEVDRRRQSQQRAQQLINEGYALEQRGEMDDAIGKYEEAVRIVPDARVTERIDDLRGRQRQISSTSETDASLIAYYKLDGTANDYSGHGNHGRIQNARFVPGKRDSGLELTGRANSFLEVPYHPSLNTPDGFTFSAWANVHRNRTWHSALIYRAGETPTRAHGWIHRIFVFWVRPNGRVMITTTADGATRTSGLTSDEGGFPYNEFTHFAATVDPALKTIRIYVNGVKVKEGPFEGDHIRGGEHPMRIGGYFQTVADQSGLTGVIDEVRLYNRALSEAEIYRLYSDVAQPSPAEMRPQDERDQQAQDRAQLLVNEGYALEQRGEIAAAIRKYEEAVRILPDARLTDRIATLRAELERREPSQ